MIEVILHEAMWVEEMIRSKSMGDRPVETLHRVARYYHSQGCNKGVIGRRLEEFILRCDADANLVMWQEYIDRAVRRSGKYPLIEIDYIPVTQKELDVITSTDGRMAQKTLFALLCLAKYSNAINPNGNNWVNRKPKEIFAMANIKLTRERQDRLINQLWEAGLVGYSSIIDNLNLNVRFIDEEGVPVLKVEDFRNLGNQYLMYIGEPYVQCQVCGLTIRKNSNSMKYCPECAVTVRRGRFKGAVGAMQSA